MAVFARYFGLWIQCKMTRAGISLANLVMMSIRKVSPSVIVRSKIMFTDSDLARLLERRRDAAFDAPISEVMNCAPLTVHPESTFADVVDLLADRKISELPVVNSDGIPVGLIDITDVIGWLPPQSRD